MSNSHLKEKEMSLKGKGLLSVMLSLPDSWDYSINGLVAISKENQTAIENTLKELKEFGYLRVDKIMPDKSKSGRIEYVYNIFEKPQKQEDKKQGLENLPLENQGVENRPQLNTNQSMTDELSIKNIKADYAALVNELFNGEPVKTAIMTWLDYKKENRQAYKPTGLKVLLNRLKKEAENFGEQYVIDEIEHSIGNRYSGIFAKKEYQTQKKQDFQKHNYSKAVLEEIETPLEDML